MKTKPNLALLSLICFIIGWVILGYGFLFLLNPLGGQINTHQSSQTPVGFVFGTTATLVQERTGFSMNLNGLNAKEGTLNATVVVNAVCNERVRDNLLPTFNPEITCFMLQVPAKVESVSVNYRGTYRDPQFFSGTSYVNKTDNLSLITVKIPTENVTFGSGTYLAFNFVMNNTFVRINPFTYKLDIQFSGSLDDSYDPNFKYYNDTISNTMPTYFSNNIIFRNAASVSLFVEEPTTDYTLSQIMPVPSGIHYYSGNTSLQLGY